MFFKKILHFFDLLSSQNLYTRISKWYDFEVQLIPLAFHCFEHFFETVFLFGALWNFLQRLHHIFDVQNEHLPQIDRLKVEIWVAHTSHLLNFRPMSRLQSLIAQGFYGGSPLFEFGNFTIHWPQDVAYVRLRTEHFLQFLKRSDRLFVHLINLVCVNVG